MVEYDVITSWALKGRCYLPYPRLLFPLESCTFVVTDGISPDSTNGLENGSITVHCVTPKYVFDALKHIQAGQEALGQEPPIVALVDQSWTETDVTHPANFLSDTAPTNPNQPPTKKNKNGKPASKGVKPSASDLKPYQEIPELAADAGVNPSEVNAAFSNNPPIPASPQGQELAPGTTIQEGDSPVMTNPESQPDAPLPNSDVPPENMPDATPAENIYNSPEPGV